MIIEFETSNQETKGLYFSFVNFIANCGETEIENKIAL